MNSERKILIISVSGIGNTILATPLVKEICDSGATVDVLGLNEGIISPIRQWSKVNKTYYLRKLNFALIKTLWRLRQERYDFSVVVYPSNRWQFNLLSFIINANNRIIHSYPGFKFKNLEFLQNNKVLARSGIHDVKQNLNLLSPLGIKAPSDIKVFYKTSLDDDQKAEAWISNRIFNRNPVVGLHLGSGSKPNDGQGEEKRWPVEKFGALVSLLDKRFLLNFIVFVGPFEAEVAGQFNSLVKKDNIFYFRGKLDTAAAIIKRCNLFVSNDSGLMHIASTGKAATIGVFGPTDHSRTAPFSKNSFVLRNKKNKCSPCLQYPYFSVNGGICCSRDFECLRSVNPEDVLKIIDDNLLLK